MSSVLFVFLLLGKFFIPLEAVIEEYLNPAVSPCDNFHQFVCGKWNEVNSDIKEGNTLGLLDADINEKISRLLESENHQELGVMEKVKAFYKSCINLKANDISLYLDVVKPKSGWAVSRSWNATKFNWLHTIAELQKYGAQIFLEQMIMPRWDNSSVKAIYLDVVKADDSTKEETISAIIRRASLNNSLVEEFISFEKQLAQFLPSLNSSPQLDDWEEVVLGYVGEAVPQIDWVKYFSTIFDHEMDLYTTIIAQNLEIMSKLADFLETSKPKTVCNYIMIKFLQYLDKYSIENNSPNECATALHQAMPLAIDQIIENHFYEHEYDQIVQDLFNYLKVEFLAEVTKLYENQRDVLLFVYTKVSVMDLQIGNSDRNMTAAAIAKYYESLDMKDDNFFLNVLEAFKLKIKKELNSLKGEPINISHQWTVSSTPFYMHPKNRIIVPFSLLQDRIFGKDSTNKYSVLGFIIGHEFLHGFDTNGVNYDYTGSMVTSALSCNPSFFERIHCIHDVMGNKGTGEKIADIGAIRLTYDAFQRSLIQIGKNIMETEGTTRPLGQSFFIDYAQFFCGNDVKSKKIFPDVYDDDELRIKHALTNFNTFANAFQCPVGSAMNPEKKCRVW